MNRTILVVDDDPSSRRVIATTLEDVAGYRVAEAPDAEAAVREALTSQPEIVVVCAGEVDVCQRLRSDPATADAVIVLLAHNGGRRAERFARTAGADVLLARPFSPLHLLRLVDRIGQRG